MPITEQRQQEPRKFYTVEVNLLEPAGQSFPSNPIHSGLRWAQYRNHFPLVTPKHPEVAFVYSDYRMRLTHTDSRYFIAARNLCARITAVVPEFCRRGEGNAGFRFPSWRTQVAAERFVPLAILSAEIFPLARPRAHP